MARQIGSTPNAGLRVSLKLVTFAGTGRIELGREIHAGVLQDRVRPPQISILAPQPRCEDRASAKPCAGDRSHPARGDVRTRRHLPHPHSVAGDEPRPLLGRPDHLRPGRDFSTALDNFCQRPETIPSPYARQRPRSRVTGSSRPSSDASNSRTSGARRQVPRREFRVVRDESY
jgi:hypothetical protein